MPTQVLDTLSTLDLDQQQRERLALTTSSLRLRRSWPRGRDHLLLEFAADDGRIIPGQWFADPARHARSLRATTRAAGKAASCVEWTAPGRPEIVVLLQGGGADAKLRGLAPLLAGPGAELLVHRPERRAVVRLDRPAGPRYAKVVPPERAAGLATSWQEARRLGAGAFATPELVETDLEAGVLVTSQLPGTALYELLGSQQLAGAAALAGAALGALHRSQAPVDRAHTAEDEIAVLLGWLERTVEFAPATGRALARSSGPVIAALRGEATGAAPLHRDFYDKQVFIAGRQAGILDFDTLAHGEPALDIANALVHFELRALQGRCPPSAAEEARAAILETYQPDRATLRRLRAYADAARLRLACVYAFRPRWAHLALALLERAGKR
jgi:hypothetical protein